MRIGRWLPAATAVLMLSLYGPGAAKAADQELRVGLDNFWEEDLDPTRMSSGGAEMISLMFDNPMQIDAAGKVVPAIVDKWDASPDGTSWTFHVREGALFQDGSKVTSKDVAFSYEHAIADGAPDASQWKSILGGTPQIDILDDADLRIHTNGPQPFLPIYSAGTGSPAIWVLPKDYFDKNGEQYFEDHPIGTGVYKFVSRTRGDQMQFAAFDQNWRHVTPDFDKVTFYLVPEEATRIAMLNTGELDATRVSLNGVDQLKATPNVSIVPGGRGVAWMPIVGSYLANGQPLGDVRVRQALSLAIDRKEVAEKLLEGLGGMPAPPRIGWNNPDMTDALRSKWQPWAESNYVFDVAKAKSLLADAGYANGFTFDLWIAPDSSATYLQDLGVLLQHYWEAVGVHANIVQTDAAAVNARRNTKSSSDLIGKAILTASDTYRANSIDYLSSFTSDKGSMNLLVGAPDQPEADKLWAEATNSMDPGRYGQIIDRLMTIETGDWVGVPVVTAPVTFAFGPRVNATIPPQAQFLSRSLAGFKYTGKEQ